MAAHATLTFRDEKRPQADCLHHRDEFRSVSAGIEAYLPQTVPESERSADLIHNASLKMSIMICNYGCLRVYPAELAAIETNVELRALISCAHTINYPLCLFFLNI